jgi:hypothetical protein
MRLYSKQSHSNGSPPFGNMMVAVVALGVLGCGSASLVKTPTDGGAGVGGGAAGRGGVGGGGGTGGRDAGGGAGGPNPGTTDGGADACAAGACLPSAFVNGPCVSALPNAYTTAIVFGLGSDAKIHEESNGGTGWGSWVTLSLDTTVLDVHSDLDCGSDGGGTIHLVATGANPLGAILHATGTGTSFSAFVRELPSVTSSTPGAAIAFDPFTYNYVIGALGPVLDNVSNGVATTLTPITDLVNTLIGPIDVADLPGDFGLQILAAFDNSGQLAAYGNLQPSSEPAYWAAPVLIEPPKGTSFTFSPTVCGDDGLRATQLVHIVAVASGQVWDTWTSSFGNTFSAWERIGTQGASAPDCTMMGDETVHVVTLSSAGHILDIYGSPGSWATTDLGTF